MSEVLQIRVEFRFREEQQVIFDVLDYWKVQVDQPTYSRPLELLKSEGLQNSLNSIAIVGKIM